MPETNESLACWPLQEMNSGSYRSEYSRRRGGQRSRSTPGELELAGRRKPLLCSCRNEVGMHFPVAAPNVPRSPEGSSKRRWCSSESRTLIWYLIPETFVFTTTCQATETREWTSLLASKNSDGISSKYYSNGISSMQAEAIAKVSRMRA